MIVMKKKRKKYDSPHMEIFLSSKKTVLLVGSNDGNLPPNPNIPI